MASITTIFACSNCGAQYSKWQGRCSECGAWGKITEEIKKSENKEIKIPAEKTVNLAELTTGKEIRLKTNIEELDRVLGGGIVAGSLVLLGGDPGVGKSTLAIQIAQLIPKTLYVSGEESAHQVKLRAERINLNLKNLDFLPQTNLEKIIATIKATRPNLAVIDSIQTVSSDDSDSAPGAVSQITASAAKLLTIAKETDVPIIIIGHVTKDGLVAGPKTLEHLVDAVLYLENDANNYYKILRSVKNRFGSTGEIGVFEMTGAGLKEVASPSEIFFDQKESQPHAGSIATVVLEGSRPFLVEIQALVAKAGFGYPQRKATGFDLNRLQMLIAVIAKIAKINLSTHDVYLNVAGGLKIKDASADLAVCLAVVSAFLDLTIEKNILAFGEVGLSGEIRNVAQAERRIKEAEKMNFSKIIAPASAKPTANQHIFSAKNIQEAIKIIS